MTDLRHRLEAPAQKAWPPLFLAAVVVVTWILVDRFGDVVYQTTAGRMLLMLIIVLGLQMFSGNSGVLSFGHITFVAIGAYSSALLTIPPEIKEFSFLTMPNWLSYWIFPAELSPLEGTLAGGGFAALFALIVAPAIVRLRGVQAGIATLALLVIANVFIVQTSSITRGTSTQIGVPTSTTLFSLMVWALIFIALAFVFRQSRFGLRLRASRENERAARSVGVKVPRERTYAWVLSAFVCGVAGALYAHYFGGTFSYLDFYFNTNGQDIVLLPIAMLVVGGMSSVTGAVVGCYLITIVYEIFRRWEVNGLAGYEPPSGTTNLVLAIVLLVTLALAPQRRHRRQRDPLARRLEPRLAGAVARQAAGRACDRRGGIDRVTSVMRTTIWRQPADLRALLGDLGPVEEQAERLEGRRIVAVGTGTSWHAANHAAWLFREAGVDCRALQAMDAAQYGIPVHEGDAIVVFSHRNTKRFSSEVLERSRDLRRYPSSSSVESDLRASISRRSSRSAARRSLQATSGRCCGVPNSRTRSERRSRSKRFPTSSRLRSIASSASSRLGDCSSSSGRGRTNGRPRKVR